MPRRSPGSTDAPGPCSAPCTTPGRAIPNLGRLWDEMEAWRLDGQGRFVQMLADRGALKPGLAVGAAIDVLWTLCSIAVYDLLVLRRGWTEDRYQAWLAHALVSDLIGE